jgi:hypothetical protein
MPETVTVVGETSDDDTDVKAAEFYRKEFRSYFGVARLHSFDILWKSVSPAWQQLLLPRGPLPLLELLRWAEVRPKRLASETGKKAPNLSNGLFSSPI